MNLAYLMSWVGPPAVPGATYRRALGGGMVAWGWADALGGARGWWFSITCRERVIVTPGWTSGGPRERDAEIERALSATTHAQVIS